ncbi:photosystem II cytochrome c-550 [Oscillatoria sp. CS-180]|uniref:photosystem II cytochrome c-550 n=1 Tax=Oscillatoria sp. CS-180 TaxID=3021720 RepID=UPI003FA73C29
MNRDIRTVPLNDSGDPITLTTKQLAQGQRKFNGSCASCHLDGGTKTNPSVDLSPATLARATPPRNSVSSIVDYLNEPTTYDGLRTLAELHPSTARTDIFPKMRDLTEKDLTAIAGYILVQPKVVGKQWSGGKPNR